MTGWRQEGREREEAPKAPQEAPHFLNVLTWQDLLLVRMDLVRQRLKWPLS